MRPRPTIAIVGANGFIGSRLVETLHLDGGYRVRAVVRRVSALASAARFSLEGRVADALDGSALREALRGCDSAVYCVAGDPQTIVRTAETVFRAADAAGCRRLVYLSTASVHGQEPATGTDERSPLSDRQPLAYNNAKVEPSGPWTDCAAARASSWWCCVPRSSSDPNPRGTRAWPRILAGEACFVLREPVPA